MTAHNHAEHVEGCFRCDLSREELIPDDVNSLIEGHKNARPEDLPRQVKSFVGELRADQIIAKSVTPKEALRQIKEAAWREGFATAFNPAEGHAMINKTVEQKTTTTFTPEPRTKWRQVSISVHTEPRMKPRIIVSAPSHGRRDGGTATLQLRDADDLKELAEIATEAYREMTKDSDDDL